MSPSTCFQQSKEVFGKTGQFFTRAEKISRKFNVFGLKRFMLEPERDVNASLQVEHRSLHFLFAVDLDLHNRDHVR